MAEHVYEKNDRHMSDGELIKRTWQYVSPYKWKLGGVLFLMIIMIGFNLLSSVIPGYITQLLSPLDASKIDFPYVITICCVYFIVNTGNTALIYITTMCLQRIGQSIIYDLRMIVFEHIENMSIAQINQIPVGSLVTRVSSDTNTLSDLFTNTIVNMIKNVLLLIGVVIVMYIIDYRIASILLCFLPIIAIISFVFRKYSRQNYRKVRHSFSVMNAFLNENISGMKITQIFNQEERKIDEFNKLNGDILTARKTDIKIFAIFRPLITLTYYLALAAVFGFGTYFYLKDVELNLTTIALAIGVIQMFYSLVSKFFDPIQQLADQLNSLQRAFTSCERLYNLLDTKPDFRDSEGAVDVDHFEGEIEFKNVWFAYNNEDWILQDVSFHILPKQVVAFVGATGAGKTTILQLIVRNYDIQKGQILIDGKDIRSIKIKSLRRGIGQMLQDVFLFSGSIKSNINLRDDEISDEDIIETCKYVNADSFIKKLENG